MSGVSWSEEFDVFAGTCVTFLRAFLGCCVVKYLTVSHPSHLHLELQWNVI